MNQQKISGGEAVYRVLRDQGIKSVFGLLGGSMLELYDAIQQHGQIRYIGARDERAAGHMADSYARITGGPGIVLGAQAGPGVVNLATSVAEAHLAYSPLVVIAGAISRQDQGKDTFQEVDQVALFASICKRSVMVTDPNRLAGMLKDAIRLAMSGRRGPVVLHIPRDLFAALVESPAQQQILPPQPAAPMEHDVDLIIDQLVAARSPVIVAGGGVKWANGATALHDFVTAINVPVVASTGHADVMPHGHPLFAGQGGPRGNHVASRLTREADLILVIGARLAFNSTFHSHDYISDSATIIQIDIEGSAIGRYFPVALGIQCDALAAIESLAKRFNQRGHLLQNQASWLERFKADWAGLMAQRQQEASNDTMPLDPKRALAEIREALPRDAIVTLDTGNVCLQAADRLAHYQTPGLVTPLDFGLVGFGYAAALGAKVAMPQRTVISIMGDGGFGFTMSEITTAVHYQLNVIAVILDNGAWGAEKAYQNEFFDGRLLGAEIQSPDYDQVAILCGGVGFAVTQPGQLGTAIAAAIESNRPAVIHVKTDPDALSTLRKDLFSNNLDNDI